MSDDPAAVPRLRLAPACHTNDMQDVVDLMAAYGTQLDPWQVDALEAGLGVREDGEWAAHTFGLNVPRQNGKSVILVARALAGALLFGEKTIIVSAHEQKTSRVLFEAMVSYFDNFPDLARRVKSISRALGREEIRLTDGTWIFFPARTRSTLRGFSVDCYLADEAQLLTDEQWESARPAMAARPNAVVWQAGTAPQQLGDGEVFGRLREAARRGDDPDLAWIEYGAPEDCDLSDRAAWRQANPGRVTDEAIERERLELSAGGFARERLNLWPVGGGEQVIDPAYWGELVATGPAADILPTALAVDAGPDRTTVVAGAWMTTAGCYHVEVLAVEPDPLAAAQFVVQKAGKRIPVLVDGASPARSMVMGLQRARVKVRETAARDMAAAAGAFVDDVGARRITHSGQDMLAAAVDGARKRPLGDGGAFAFARRDGGVFLAPLVAVVLARFGASSGRVRTGQATFV